MPVSDQFFFFTSLIFTSLPGNCSNATGGRPLHVVSPSFSRRGSQPIPFTFSQSNPAAFLFSTSLKVLQTRYSSRSQPSLAIRCHPLPDLKNSPSFWGSIKSSDWQNTTYTQTFLNGTCTGLRLGMSDTHRNPH